MMQKFKVGDKVEWVSQSAGSYTRKTGKIVRTVYKGEICWEVAALKYGDTHKIMFGGWSPPFGCEEAYFVEVLGKTSRAKPKLYMPYPKNLRLCEEV